MRFFKYLVFLVLSIISINSFAANVYKFDIGNDYPKIGELSAPTKEQLCSKAFPVWVKNYPNPYATYSHSSISADNRCLIYTTTGAEVAFSFKTVVEQFTCPSNGSPATREYAIGEPIDLVVCAPNPDGTFCKYDSPGGKMNWGDHIRVNYSSVGTAPVSSCTPKKENQACNPKDPYGGCFKPPNDKCTRFADGSIACPPDEPTPVPKSQCDGGATYCERPPTGCPTGYVSGSFNGKQLCVKSSPSTPDPKDPTDPANDGSDSSGSGTSTTEETSTSTSTNTNADGSSSTTTTTTTTNNTTVNNFKIDLSAVVNAVNAVTAQLISVKSEIVNALGLVDKKLDVTNTKIDTTNAKLTDLNASSLKQEQLLKDIRDKTVSDQPASSASTDLDGVHSRLDDIKKILTDSDGVSAEDGLITVDKFEFQNQPDKFQWSAQCPAPIQTDTSIIGYSWTYSFSFDNWCAVLAKLSNYFVFAATFGACLIIAGVRNG